MSPDIYLLTIGLPLLTAIIVFAMKYAAAFAAARARQADLDAMQRIAEGSAACQADTTASLKAIEAELARVSRSLVAVETILKQVG